MAQSTVEHSKRDVVYLTEKAPIQVLHVDDEAGFLKAAKPCLEMQGTFEVETALSVEEAKGKMKKKKFDVIVSDYVMPEKSGLEFLKELRDSGNNIPFIIFTGKGREGVAIKALNLGADQYLNKVGHPEAVYGELAHGIHRCVERKRAANMLRDSEEKYRNLFENARDVTLTLDLKGKVTSINKAAVEYGFKRDEVIGKNMRKFVPKKYWPKLLKELVQLARGKAVKGKVEINTPKGKKIAEYSSNPIIIENKVVGVQTILRDITERKKTEEQMIRVSSAVKMTTDSIVISDIDAKIIDVNEATLKMYGTDDREDLIGKNSFDFIAPEDREKALAGTKETLEKGYVKGREYRIITKDGGRIPVEMSVTVMKNADGKPIGFVGISRDITERKKAEEQIRHLAKFPSENPNPVLRIAKDGTILYANAASKSLLSEWKTKIGQPVPHQWRRYVTDVFSSGKKEEVEVKHGDCVFSFMLAPVTDAGYVNVYGRDMTERKQAEEELRSSEKRLNILFEFAPDAYYLNDLKGNFVDGNKAAEELTGYNRSELIGKSFLKLKLLPRRQILKAAKLLAKNAFGKPTGPDEFVLNRKDGTQVPVEIRTFPVKIKGQTLVLGIARDITERKRAEEELNMTLEKLKILNDKLGVVGKLTRHDVRNKLSAVTMNVFLAKQKLAGDHEALKHLSQIESACGQVERIFEFARIYEKLGAEELVYMDVEKIVGEAVMLFSDLHGVQVVNDCRGLTVLADSLLRQLLYNLIDNSLKHGKKVSQIRVHYEEMVKNQLKLIYEDDGIGIPKAEKEKIFKEGYGEGSGYGLYLIRKMCEVYGWTIRETGKHGKGARFTITIPKMGKNGKENYRLLKNLDF